MSITSVERLGRVRKIRLEPIKISIRWANKNVEPLVKKIVMMVLNKVERTSRIRIEA